MIKNTALSLKELYLIPLYLQCSITETKNNFRKLKSLLVCQKILLKVGMQVQKSLQTLN